jgi:hypothetical protein
MAHGFNMLLLILQKLIRSSAAYKLPTLLAFASAQIFQAQ